MEIHQLQYFLHLEKHRHFSLAADAAAVSQSNLSQQIKKLEKELETELFIRNTRSVQLTPSGEEFLKYAERILAEIDQAKYAVSEHVNLTKGHLKIGAMKSSMYLGIGAIISEFQKNNPGISVEIFEENSDQLKIKLNRFEIDVAFITYLDSSQDGFDFYPLIYDKFVLLTPHSHFSVQHKNIDIKKLIHEKFLVLQSSAIHQVLVQTCHQAGFKPNVIFAGSQIEMIKELIKEGMGISLFSSRVAKSLLGPETAIVDLTTPIKRINGLAVSKHSNSLAVEEFKEFVFNFVKNNLS